MVVPKANSGQLAMVSYQPSQLSQQKTRCAPDVSATIGSILGQGNNQQLRMDPSDGPGRGAIIGQANSLDNRAITSHAKDLARGGAVIQKRFEKHKKVDFQD